ncbi:MAG: amino acid permease, partial [Pseudomonadota bacterium]
MSGFGVNIPVWLATDFRTAAKIPGLYDQAPHLFGIPVVFNLLAFSIVMVLTVVLVWGIKESAKFNAVMVAVKIVTLLFFVTFLIAKVSPATMSSNWIPFQPNGWGGTFAGAAVVFFAYIGFDAVSTVAEETRNPTRDLPIGIITSLLVCTVLYVVVAAVFTGVFPYRELVTRLSTQQAEPLTMALDYVAPNALWATTLVAFGSVVAHTAVLFVFQLGQPRIFFAMARDGLLPASLAKVHPGFRTPYVTTILTGLAVGGVAAIASIDEMVDLTNIGTLFAFVLVCIGIPVLRFKDPDRPRPFRVPFGPLFLPVLGALSCVFLMYYLPPASWWRFVGWLFLGLAIYTAYGYHHSALGRKSNREVADRTPFRLVSAGFLAIAGGLFTIPHNAYPSALVLLALEGSWTSRIGLLLIATGALFAISGWLKSRRKA